MQMILIARDLWEIVDIDETTTIPIVVASDKSTQEKLVNWIKRDKVALAQIVMSITGAELIHIIDIKSSNEAWTKICNMFQEKGLSTKIFLRRKFFNAKLKDSTTMQAHINYVRQLAEQVDGIGSPVTDNDIAMTLLCSLPEQYDPLIMALESRVDQDLNSKFISLQLLAEERRKQKSNIASTSHVVAKEDKIRSDLKL